MPNLQDQVSKVTISDGFLNELLRFDFTSTKKGRGHASLLIERKKKDGDQQEQIIRNQNSSLVGNAHIQFSPSNQVLHPPAGVMDVAKWHNQLTSAQKLAYQRGLQGMSGNKSEADGFNK